MIEKDQFSNERKVIKKPWDPNRITYIGETNIRDRKTRFGIKALDRSRHVYVIGKTGVGKSSLLEVMAAQDFANDEGIIFMDPHGSSVELLINHIPKHRVKDVVYFAPFDFENPIAFNVMEDIGYDKRHLVASSLLSAFKKIWGAESWSARMEHILNNTLLALLESPDTTLLDVTRMYAYKEFRNKVISTLKDPQVKAFWIDEYSRYSERFAQEATPAIQNKIGQFTSNPVIRNIIGQPKSSFNFREAMDDGKIMLINLSKGRIGDSNAALLGVLLSTKIYLSALSRADLTQEKLSNTKPVNFYVDEFQSFASDTFADILSEARKYKLNLTIAHQYIDQMEENVRNAVFGNVGTIISFRVGPLDGDLLEKIFTPNIMADDLINLERGQIYLSLTIDGIGSAPFSARSFHQIEGAGDSYREEIIKNSQQEYGSKRALVERDIEKRIEELRAMEKTKTTSKDKKPHQAKRNFNNRDNQNFANRNNKFHNKNDFQHKNKQDHNADRSNQHRKNDDQSLKNLISSTVKDKQNASPIEDEKEKADGWKSLKNAKDLLE